MSENVLSKIVVISATQLSELKKCSTFSANYKIELRKTPFSGNDLNNY
jgi:hypothetical protein